MDTQTSILLNSIRHTFSALDESIVQKQLYFIDKALSELFTVKKQIEHIMYSAAVSEDDSS